MKIQIATTILALLIPILAMGVYENRGDKDEITANLLLFWSFLAFITVRCVGWYGYKSHHPTHLTVMVTLAPVRKRARLFPESFCPWAPVFAGECGVASCR